MQSKYTSYVHENDYMRQFYEHHERELKILPHFLVSDASDQHGRN